MAGNSRQRAAGVLRSEVMAVLHQAGRALTPGDVQQHLGGDLAYTTVVTILSRLHASGLLVRSKVGRSYTYAPVSDEPGLAARRMRQVMEREPDPDVVLARFVDALSDRDERLLRELLEDRDGD
ncbi:MAG: transcriptional regulator [Streptosporangiaceae bacterium]|jgi:predicted transcriptional regulator|nr:transcriptional regulator [Streptosporangiaceae bacterium]